MADTTYTDFVTPIPAAWLNDINDHTYNNTPVAPATTVHPANVIANTPAGNIAATDIQTAINELDTEKIAVAAIGTSVPSPTGTGASGTWGISITGNAATASDATTHIANPTAAHAASAIANTPAGNIAATTVQAAIDELDSEKVASGGALGTPSSGTLTNCTGTAAGLTAGGNALLAGSASQTFSVATATTAAHAVRYDQALGLGQTWQDVTGSRASGVTYTNTTGKPIFVSITETNNGTSTLAIDGIQIVYVNGTGVDFTLAAIVPAGSSYVATLTGLIAWTELR